MPSASAGAMAGSSPARPRVSRSRSTRASPSTGVGPTDGSAGDAAIAAQSVIGPPPIEAATGAVRRTAERAASSVSATTPATTTTAAATAARRGPAPRAGRRRTGRSWPARPAARGPPDPGDDAGLGQHRAPRPGRGRAEQPQPVQLGPAVRDDGRERVDDDDRREQHDHPDDHVVEQVDRRRRPRRSRAGGCARRCRPASACRRRPRSARSPAPAPRRAGAPGAGCCTPPGGRRPRAEQRPGQHREVPQQPRREAARPSATRIEHEPEVCIAAYGSVSWAVTVTVTTPMASAVADQEHGGGHPPPAQPLGPARPSLGAMVAGPRVARRPASRSRAALTSTTRTAVAAGRGARRRRRPSRRPGRRCGAARADAGRRRWRAPRRQRDGDGRDQQGLGADQPPGLAWGRADGAEQADLDLALGDRDADRRDHGEEHDEGAPPADHGAHDHERLLVGGRDGAGRRRDEGRERAHQRGAEQDRQERRERSGRAVPQRGEARGAVMTPPAVRPARRGGPSGRRRRRPWAGPSGPATRPSTRKTTVSAYDAATGSWVTMTTVCRRSSTQAAQQREHLVGGGGVEGAGRLVGQDHRRVGDQRPGDRHALLLAAGQLGRQVPRRGRRGRPGPAGRAPAPGPTRCPASRSGSPTFCSAVR